jgi:hypothetical protein
MGGSREDRLHLRSIEWLVLLAAFAAGLFLPLDTFSGDPGRLLVTFLGLISASALPTISLILGSMAANGRSVQALNELQRELSAAMDAMFALFGLGAVAVAILLSLAIPMPGGIARIPHAASILERGGQAALVGCVSLIVTRAGQMPGVLRRSLEIRHKIAVDEARRKTIEAAPHQGEMSKIFASHPEFGATVTLEDLPNSRDGPA